MLRAHTGNNRSKKFQHFRANTKDRSVQKKTNLFFNQKLLDLVELIQILVKVVCGLSLTNMPEE